MSVATEYAVQLKQHEYLRNGGFIVYSPHAFAKATCDPEWTRSRWPFEVMPKETFHRARDAPT